MAAKIGILAGDAAFFLSRRHRKIGCHNLKLAYGDSLSDVELQRILRDVFRNFFQTIIEFIRLPSFSYEEAMQYTTPEDRQRLDECLKRGKGVILIAAHFGNWELMAAAGALAGYPISAVARPMNHSIWDRIINEMRELSGLKVIVRDRSAFTIVKRLKRNEIIGILADQNSRKQHVFVDFFGRKAAATSGPALLALKTGAAMLPAFMLRNGHGGFRLIIEEPLEMPSSGNIKADTLRLTQAYANLLERYIRQYPSQWLWLHRRWRTRPPGEPAIY